MDGLGKIDWSLIQAFLAVAETGSLSGAGRQLGLSQPTLGRQVQALEAQLGAALFLRQPRGMALTEAGQALLGPARAMQEAAAALALAAAGADTGLSGTVRLTASDFVSTYHLPPILARLRRDAPELEIELVSSDSTENLLFREADIALRMYRPRQLDMIARHLGDLSLGLYAARSYAEEHGLPDTPEALTRHQLIGFDRDESILRGMRALGLKVDRHAFGLRCDANVPYFQLLLAGCGIGFAQSSVAARHPELLPVLPEVPIPPLPVWLTCHANLRRLPRIDLVWRALEEGMQGALA